MPQTPQHQNIVSITKCDDYDYAAVKAAIEANITHLGGLEGYITRGERVLLKINMLMKKRPEEACTTHPVFVRALSDILLDYGCHVVIGDSPGGMFSEGYLRGIYEATGMRAIADSTAATLNANYGAFELENPQGLLIKRFAATDMLNDVDKVISVSKMKTHGFMGFTGAVKNMFGIVPGLIKFEYHMNMPDHDNFADALIDVCLAADPVLCFMDGIVAMEGAGPSGGEPRQMGLCIASPSPYALDMAAVAIIGMAFDKTPTVRRAIARGLGPADLDGITFCGTPWQDVAVTDYDIPEIEIILRRTLKVAGRFLKPKPIFVKKLCNGCQDCVKSCPPKVISMAKHRPRVALKGCIRCFCCQELCPKKAIKIHRPRLLKFLSRL